MRNLINTYIKTHKKMLKTFGCPGNYFILPLMDCAWSITGGEDMPILSYDQNDITKNAVIVCHNNTPLIYRANGYVLVVAIDCIKTAFVFDGKREI
jgi:hypothetical protein